MYKVAEPKMVQCPFNRYHVINRVRIQKHILKCQKNYEGIKYIDCVYNFSHKIKPKDMVRHYESCPDSPANGLPLFLKTLLQLRINLPETNASGWESDFSDDSTVSLESFPDTLKDKQVLENDFDSDSEPPKPQKQLERYFKSFESKNFDSDDDEVDCEPPLVPKMSSTLFNQTCSTSVSSFRSFGRGKNVLVETKPKLPRRTDHLLPDLSRESSECGSEKSASRNSFRNCDSLSNVSKERKHFGNFLKKNCESEEDQSLDFIDIDNYLKIK